MTMLQKLAPPLAHSEDSGEVSCRHIQYRRRTLQTVRELASEDSTPSDVSPTSPKHSSSSVQISQDHGNPRTSRGSRRKSLPHQGLQTQPLLPFAVPELATPFDWGRRSPQYVNSQAESSGTSNHDRLSVDSSSNNKPLHRQVLKLKGGRHSLPRDGYHSKREQFHQDQLDQIPFKGKGRLPVRVQDMAGRTTASKEGWNATRERELKRREQEAMEAKAHRERQGRGIAIGSLSTLPSMSPLPVAKPNEVYIRGRAIQHQLLQNGQTMDGNRAVGRLHKRPSHTTMNCTNSVSAQLLNNANTNSSPHLTFYDPVQRPPSSRNNATRTLVNPLALNPVPISRSFASPISQPHSDFPREYSGALVLDRGSQSRRSSAHSTATTNTSISNSTRQFQMSRRCSNSPHSVRSRRHQNGVTKEQLDALATLTASAHTPEGRMTAECLTFVETESKRLDDEVGSASVVSDGGTRITLYQERHKSRAKSRVSRNSYSTGHHSSTAYGDEGLSGKSESGLTNESVRLLREREKLLRWKAEREKMEFERKERVKIKERVKRVNELEEERSKALEKETKKKKKKKKKKRGCCGFLGG